MADFDDEGPSLDAAPAAAARRRPIAADFDDEDEQPTAEGAPVPQARPPMKSWGDSGPAPAPSGPIVTRAVPTETNVSDNFDEGAEGDAGQPPPAAASAAAPAAAFGRRAGGGRSSTRPRDKYDADQITDITEIPDLEDEGREPDLTNVVAEAPNVRSNRVVALQELDQAIQFRLPTATADGIDLSLLMSALSPQEHVAETDQLWEFDQLFADVSSEMMAEMEPPEKEEGEEDDDDAGVAKGDGEKRKPLSQQTVRDRSAKVDTQNK